MEARVVALEADMKNMTATMHRLEVSSARIESTLATLATKADIAKTDGTILALNELVNGQGSRLSEAEKTLRETVATALSKTIGVGGGITLFGGMAAIVVIGIGVLRYFHFL